MKGWASLRLKGLAVLLVGLGLSLALLVSLSTEIHTVGQEEEELQKVRELARATAAAILPEEVEHASERLADLGGNEGLLGIFVVRGNGVPFLQEDLERLQRVVRPDEVPLWVSGGTSSLWGEDREGNSVAVGLAPIGPAQKTERRPILLVIRSSAPEIERISQSNTLLVMGMALGLLLVVLIGYFALVRGVIHPLRSLVRTASKVEETLPGRTEDWNRRSGDELEDLQQALDQMQSHLQKVRVQLQWNDRQRHTATERWKEAEVSLERAEKLASVGEMTAGFAHEMGNPMGILQGYAELLQSPDCSSEEKELFLNRIQDAVGRMDQVLRELLRFSRNSEHDMTTSRVDLRASVDSVLGLVRMQQRFAGIECNADLPEGCLRAEGERGGVEQVLLNLLLNGADVLANAGSITIRVLEDGPFWHIAVHDTGPGISEEHLRRVFDPFFTTKPEGVGTGLGLAISQRIIHRFGGTLGARNGANGGAIFDVRLKRAASDTSSSIDSTAVDKEKGFS